MTAFADITAYKAAILTPKQMTLPVWTKNSFALSSVPLSSYWRQTGAPGATSAPTIPSSAVALDNTTAGALDALVTDSLSMWLAQMEVRSGLSADALVILCDRLSHQGGLSGTTTGAQTTNLPTAALTRYTSGAGVMAALEIYTGVGSTATTATVSYTNQAGTSGQTSQAVAFGGAGTPSAAGHVFPLSLASGDTGVKAVASVTLAASTVSAAGNFGVTLYKPLMMTMVPAGNANSVFATGAWFWDALYSGGGNLPQITSGAHLAVMVMAPGSIGNSSNMAITPVIGLA